MIPSYEPSWLAVPGTRRKNKIHSFIHIGQGLGTRLPLALTDGCGRVAETVKQSENAEVQRPFK